MSDLINFPLTTSDTEEKDEIIPKTDSKNLHKIRHIVNKNKQVRSQSAPLEEADNDDDDEFLSSYNYYVFYHNKNPKDPHLPKPTYVPNHDLGDIKESKAKDEEDLPKSSTDKQLETINQMMNNLNLDKPMDINKLLNDEFQSDNTNTNNGKLNNNLSGNNNTNMGLNYGNMLNNDNTNNLLPKNLLPNQLNIFGDDNFNLYNFVNNENINSSIPTNNPSKKSDNNINSIGNNISFNPNVNTGMKEFDIYNSNKFINNNLNLNNPNINTNINNNNDLFNMMLIQNMQKEPSPNLNPNFNINYFSQQINNNNILLSNYNNNNPQSNLDPNFNFSGINNNNMYFNNNLNSKNYPNLFSKNNPKKKFPNNFGNNNFTRGQNMNNKYNNPNIPNPKFFPQKNPKINTFKNITGLSDFTNNQKRDLTDIKHLEEMIQTALKIKSNINTNNNNAIPSYEMNDIIMLNQYKNDILNLSKDVTGNYAIQKLLNNRKIPEVNFIIESLKNNIYELTLNLYGCRCVQELISILDIENMYIITSELKPFYEKCIQDKNGNHVIQKLIEKVNSTDLNDIYLVAVNNIINLSKHQYGCRVIQRLFKYCNYDQIKHMLSNLFLNINDLIQDQYGNYVIQFILENQAINNDDLLPIFSSLKGNIYKYSFHKFASNVVERCITFGTENQKKDIINEVVEFVKRDEELIINMVRDKFANYVVQKIIEYSEGEIQQYFINIILGRQNQIKNEGFSKHVLNYIEKLNSGNIKGKQFKNNNSIYKQYK